MYGSSPSVKPSWTIARVEKVGNDPELLALPSFLLTSVIITLHLLAKQIVFFQYRSLSSLTKRLCSCLQGIPVWAANFRKQVFYPRVKTWDETETETILGYWARWCGLSSLLGYWAHSWTGRHSDAVYQHSGTPFADLGRMTGRINPTWY